MSGTEAQPQRHATERRGTELVYWTWSGEAPSALLLHGIGNYGRYWDLFADAVNKRLALVAPDARGHGESGRPADGYAPTDFVADAIAVLDAARVVQAVVVGHSMGGLHAIALAAAYPERVRALVIVDASPEPLPEGSERARRLLTERPTRFASDEEARAYLERTSPGYTDAVYRNRLEFAFRREGQALIWRSDPNALRQILSSADRRDRWLTLRSVAAPTLVVRGTRSNVFSPEVAKRLAAALPDGKLVELDAGHNVPLDRPAELAEAVVAVARG